MNVLITGSRGFIGTNLRVRLSEIEGIEVREFHRQTDPRDLLALVADCDTIVHLAGVNRPSDVAEFERVNVDLTASLCAAVRESGGGKRFLFASSVQAGNGTSYGISKLRAEGCCCELRDLPSMAVAICRYPNVFGKWSQPHYNSAVATFCHRAVCGEPIDIHDPASPLTLVYVDDVVEQILGFIHTGNVAEAETVQPTYRTTVGEVARTIQGFAADRPVGRVAEVGAGLTRALYATFISFLPSDRFTYPLTARRDPRGAFVEMLKTASCGQVSFFTAGEGITRGSHYHHTKTEKFLVVRGRARFRFRHVLTDQRLELVVDAEQPRVVETIPGWVHDITNIGRGEMIVLLWANEVFDPARPDTYAAQVRD